MFNIMSLNDSVDAGWYIDFEETFHLYIGSSFLRPPVINESLVLYIVYIVC